MPDPVTVRLRFGNGQQARFTVADEDHAARLRALARRLTSARTPAAQARTVLTDAAQADAAELALLERLVGEWETEAAAHKPERAVKRVVTFEGVGRAWTSGELSRRFPDQVADIIQDSNKQRLERYVYPVLGSTPIWDVTRDACDEVMRRLPDGLTRSTRRQYAGLLNRILNLAELAGYIQRNPLPRGWLPKPSPKKRFPILYPSEDQALLACTAVPLAYRVFYGFLHREGMRMSEALRLRWSDLDLVHQVLRIDINKTDHSRWWKLGDGVAAALEAWRELNPTAEVVFTGILDPGHLAGHCREHLRLAGIDRADLYAKGPNSGAFGIHSFRRSFATRSLAGGRGEDFTRQRTGHKSDELLRYRQAANALAELDLGEVVPLHLAIPEFSESTGESAEPANDTETGLSSRNNREKTPREGGGIGRRARFRF